MPPTPPRQPRPRCPAALLAATLCLGACAGTTEPSGPAPARDSAGGFDLSAPPLRDGSGTTPTDVASPPAPPPDGSPPSDTVPPAPDAPPSPDAGYSCGPNDGDCHSNADYLKPCSGGTCFGAACCCPTARVCRAGSFPVCCDPGTTCFSAATGECR